MFALFLVASLVQATGSDAPIAFDSPPAAHAQNIEAFAAPDIEKSTPTAIVAINDKQLHDPNFRPLANQLGDALAGQGFNMAGRGERFRNVVTLEYQVKRDTNGDLPGQSTSNPSTFLLLGTAAFPAYRRLTVTAYAPGEKGHVRVLWRTVMAEDGFVSAVAKTIPPLVAAGQEYFGRNLTQLAVADCSDLSPTGSHLASRPCGPVRALIEGGTVRRPEVTIGPLSTPSPSVSAPPR